MEFDAYAEAYQAEVENAAGVSVEGLAGEKARLINRVLSRELGDPKKLRVLDVGCGIGLVDCELEQTVGRLCGADVSGKSLKFAALRAPSTQFVQYNGVKLPFGDATFDAVFAICVLHHVRQAVRPAFIAEMLRPLRAGGIAIVIEHNPLNPVTRLIVSRCPFDADAVLLRLRESADLLRRAGAPPAGRRYIGFSPFRHALVERAERAIEWFPAGAQYGIWGVKRANDDGTDFNRVAR